MVETRTCQSRAIKEAENQASSHKKFLHLLRPLRPISSNLLMPFSLKAIPLHVSFVPHVPTINSTVNFQLISSQTNWVFDTSLNTKGWPTNIEGHSTCINNPVVTRHSSYIVWEPVTLLLHSKVKDIVKKNASSSSGSMELMPLYLNEPTTKPYRPAYKVVKFRSSSDERETRRTMYFLFLTRWVPFPMTPHPVS